MCQRRPLRSAAKSAVYCYLSCASLVSAVAHSGFTPVLCRILVLDLHIGRLRRHITDRVVSVLRGIRDHEAAGSISQPAVLIPNDISGGHDTLISSFEVPGPVLVEFLVAGVGERAQDQQAQSWRHIHLY